MQLYHFLERTLWYQEEALLGACETKDTSVCHRWMSARVVGLAVCTLNYCLQNSMDASAHSTRLWRGGF
jgi:hypothetical protein